MFANAEHGRGNAGVQGLAHTDWRSSLVPNPHEKREDSQSKGTLGRGFREQELTVSGKGRLFHTKETAKATSERKEEKKHAAFW